MAPLSHRYDAVVYDKMQYKEIATETSFSIVPAFLKKSILVIQGGIHWSRN